MFEGWLLLYIKVCVCVYVYVCFILSSNVKYSLAAGLDHSA